MKSYRQHDHTNVSSFVSPNNTLATDTDIDISILFPKWEMCVHLLGPCNGIVCITNYSSIVTPGRKETNPSGTVLCNPSIREFKVVPVPVFTYPPGLKSLTVAMGFGFDPYTDDYKVVRIVHLFEDDDDDNFRHDSLKVEVYN